MSRKTLISLMVASGACWGLSTIGPLMPQATLEDGRVVEVSQLQDQQVAEIRGGGAAYKIPLWLMSVGFAIATLSLIKRYQELEYVTVTRQVSIRDARLAEEAEADRAVAKIEAELGAEDAVLALVGGEVESTTPFGGPDESPKGPDDPIEDPTNSPGGSINPSGESTNPSSLVKEVPTNLLKALNTLGFPCDFVETFKGATVLQHRLKPKNSKNTKAILGCEEALQIELSLPKTPLVSIEAGYIAVSLPRADREVLHFADWVGPKDVLSLPMGVDVTGTLVEMPLDARSLQSVVCGGVPGGGKSSWIVSMLGAAALRYTPDQIKFVVFDGKNGVEHSRLKGSPFLDKPVATDPDSAYTLMLWLMREIETRYEYFRDHKVTNLEDYNQLEGVETLPYLLVIADEFQDLFDLAAKGDEDKDGYPTPRKIISSNASLGRAAGVLMVLATQRPDRDVIPGQIDGKCSTRVAFTLQRKEDSKMVLSGSKGAENLLLKGDMLYKFNGSAPQRLQGLLCEYGDVEEYLFPSKSVTYKQVREAYSNLGDMVKVIKALWGVSKGDEGFEEAKSECYRLMESVLP